MVHIDLLFIGQFLLNSQATTHLLFPFTFLLMYSIFIIQGAKLILNLRKNASLDGDVTRYNVSEVGDMEFWDPEFSSRSKLPDDMEMTGLDPNEGFV